MRILFTLIMSAALSGCAAAALPCKITRDVAEVIPFVGGLVAEPFDACAKAID